MAYFVPKFTFAMVQLKTRLSSRMINELELIPGIKVKRDKIRVPHHATSLFLNYINSIGLEIDEVDVHNEKQQEKSFGQWRSQLLSKGEIQEWVMDGFLTPFQKDVLDKCGHWNSAHLWHATGAGKTLSAILWALCHRGSILVLTRAASRIQHGREFERFTNLRPYVVRPAAQRKKGSRTLSEYTDWCRENNKRPVVILGWESLTSIFEEIQTYAPSIIIYDEAHKGKNTKRYEAIPLPDYCGDNPLEREKFYASQEREARKRKGFIPDPNDPKAQKNKHFDPNQRVMIVPTMNITSCCSQLSSTANYICCTTATPIKDRVRDLWGQLDLAEPKSWGTFNEWALRYCNAKPGRFGGLDTTGQSNLTELTNRLVHVTHKIDYRETHRHLPAKRRQSMYIAPEDQCRPSAGFAKQLKAVAKMGGTALLEVRLAQAASSKRRAILEMVSDHVASGHKVTIFSGRRKDVEDIGNRVKKLDIVKKSKGKIKVWAAHGGNDATERQGIVDQYMESTEACVLVGTGNSFGESLNMQDTDAAFFVMLPYTPGELRQWEGRFCRLGQKRPVTIYYVIAEGTVDEHVADILISKLPAVQKIAEDEELAEAKSVIAGMDNPEELADSILAKL